MDGSGCPGGLDVLMGYHYRRPRERPGRNQSLETAIAAVVLLILIGGAFVFLFIYHDFPLRIS